MKGILERELTAEDKEDQDTVEAYDRIKSRLEQVLKDQPALSAVEKNSLSRKVDPVDQQQTSFDRELITGSMP
jgi:hypothetical protein